jgi:hypothetical protein
MALLALQYSTKLIEARDLPVPADLLGRYSNTYHGLFITKKRIHVEKLDLERQDALSQVFSAIYRLFDRLQKESGCYYKWSSKDCLLPFL